MQNNHNYLPLFKAAAKRWQNFKATYCHIVGRIISFAHPVVTCCDLLDVVGLSLKMVKFFMQLLWMLHDVVLARLARFVQHECCDRACLQVQFEARNMS